MKNEQKMFDENVDYLIENFTSRELATALLLSLEADKQNIADFSKKSPEVQLTKNPTGNLCSESVQVDTDGFIVWEGGSNRPVTDDTIVHVKIRSGVHREPIAASYWPQICWNWRSPEDPKNEWDIIAYKVVK